MILRAGDMGRRRVSRTRFVWIHNAEPMKLVRQTINTKGPGLGHTDCDVMGSHNLKQISAQCITRPDIALWRFPRVRRDQSSEGPHWERRSEVFDEDMFKKLPSRRDVDSKLTQKMSERVSPSLLLTIK